MGFQRFESPLAENFINTNIFDQFNVAEISVRNFKSRWFQGLNFVVVQVDVLQRHHFLEEILVQCLDLVVVDVHSLDADKVIKSRGFDCHNVVVIQAQKLNLLHVFQIEIANDC